MNSCCRNSYGAWVGAASAALLLAACEPSKTLNSPEPGSLCQADSIAITEIQGADYRSPLLDQAVTVSGVVTYLAPPRGFYLEQTSGFDERRSRALFIADGELSQQLMPGDQLAVQGVVAELGSGRDTLTSLENVTASSRCGEGQKLPSTDLRLPLEPWQREALEGMHFSSHQSFTISDVYRFDRGEIGVSAAGVLRAPTEVALPGRESLEQLHFNRDHKLALSAGQLNLLALGTGLDDLSGIMGHDGRNPVVFAKSFETGPLLVPDTPPAPAAGALRIVNANVQNFFNGNGQGGGFPTERGAETPAELEQQAGRIVAALGRLQPHVVALQELENDGFDKHSASADLARRLADQTGFEWQVVAPKANRVGSDVIAVGIFYRPDQVEPLGPARVMDAAPFRNLSRQPLTQAFRHIISGETFLLSVNHLKSKGSCPDNGPDANQRDGQACWAAARTAAVETLLPWLREQAQQAGTQRILITGDMNAYRMEDPIQAFVAGGMTDLAAEFSGPESYSYVYRGERGTLDYAFGNPALRDAVATAFTWNINADWPRNVDLQPGWLRYSDHDPVVVDLDFSQSATSR